MKEPTPQLYLAAQAIEMARAEWYKAIGRVALAEAQRDDARREWKKAKLRYKLLKDKSRHS